MSMTTFQKVTLISCLVLCVSLLLPKIMLSNGRKDVGQKEVGPGRFPPSMMHRQQMSESQAQRGGRSPGSKAYNPDALAKAKGVGAGGKGGGKSNLMGQIIPIYGFGILLYILYILFKLTSRVKNVKTENRFNSLETENLKRKITDFELAQLQERLKETEEVMERIVSHAKHSSGRVKRVTAEHEEKLLRQLKEITRVMQESHLVDGVSMGTEGHGEPYENDWEGDTQWLSGTLSSTDEPEYRQHCYHQTTALGEADGLLPSTEEFSEAADRAVEEAGLEGELSPPEATPHDTEVKQEEAKGLSSDGQVQPSRKRVGVVHGATRSVDDEFGEEEEEKEEPELKVERMGFGCSGSCHADVQDGTEGLSYMPRSRERDNFSFAESEITTEMGFGGFRKRHKRHVE